MRITRQALGPDLAVKGSIGDHIQSAWIGLMRRQPLAQPAPANGHAPSRARTRAGTRERVWAGLLYGQRRRSLPAISTA
jgi:hypothetical protein